VRVLITGGAGFLGSHLSDKFLGLGHTVIGADNFITGSPDNIQHLIGRSDYEFIQQDVSEPFQVSGPLDAVLHFASPASPIDYLKFPIETLKVGAHGTLNALDVARSKGARFLLASTSEIYGDPLQHPQPESYLGNVDTIGPRGCYDEAKRFGESMTMAYHRVHGVDTRIVRIFNTYGERMRLDDGRVVPNFVGQALRGEPLTVYGDGQQTRSFCYWSDLIEGITRLALLERSADSMLPVNIGNPREMTILEFAQAVNLITGNPGGIVYRQADRIQGDPQTRRPDITRARKLLNWEPVIALEQGIQNTIAYYEPRVRA
jgi:dTDP-glucose 4,6-dehydratase